MNERPTLSEVARAKPHRGSGAPGRCASHKDAILALLRERGPQGVLSSELYDSPEKFGRSPRNRISELRAGGCLISGEPRGASDWHYVLIRDSEGAKPSESDFMRRRREEDERAAPLFVVRQ
jgi:hypothetical protein